MASKRRRIDMEATTFTSPESTVKSSDLTLNKILDAVEKIEPIKNPANQMIMLCQKHFDALNKYMDLKQMYRYVHIKKYAKKVRIVEVPKFSFFNPLKGFNPLKSRFNPIKSISLIYD